MCSISGRSGRGRSAESRVSSGGGEGINGGSIGAAPDGLATTPTYGSGEHPTVAHATWIESTPRGIHVEQITVPLEAPPRQLLAAP